MHRFVLWLLVIATATASPLRILAIGDSLSEEYTFEVPFSAPASDPFNSNVKNWPELFHYFRPNDATLGPYLSGVASYPDIRDGGHRYNFGVPGYTTSNWIDVLNQSSYNPFTDNAQEFLWYISRQALIDQLPDAQVVIIFLGGNDLKQDYGGIYNDAKAQSFYDNITSRLGQIHAFVRSRHPSLPIVICTIPNVGATPDIQLKYTDPIKIAGARARIVALNQSIISLTASKTLTGVARIDHLTDRIYDEIPFQLNGTVFTLSGDPENPPNHLFCRDNFHPATAAQAFIANEIIAAINPLVGTSIPPFSYREILQTLLGLNPDQPYLDWLALHPLVESAMNSDPDHDGFPNLVEMALSTAPDQFSSPLTGTWSPNSSITWTPDPVAARYINLYPEESCNLVDWHPVPESRLSSSSATPNPTWPTSFMRLRASPR